MPLFRAPVVNVEATARIAAALAQALGLPGSDDAWRTPLPELAQTRRQWWRAETRWVRRHLLPWIWHGLRGQFSADGRGPKRPTLAPP